jgi:hypothetical protein
MIFVFKKENIILYFNWGGSGWICVYNFALGIITSFDMTRSTATAMGIGGTGFCGIFGTHP